MASVNTLLIYDSLPEVFLEPDLSRKQMLLNNYINSLLFKDIFEIEDIRNPVDFKKLLQLLALQLGKEVNSNEDWMGVKIPKLLKTGYLGWSITDDFILHMRPDNAPHDDQYAYVGRFSYDPTTKEFLPQRISSSHSQAINKHGSSRYNKYIRVIYLMDQETILLRN